MSHEFDSNAHVVKIREAKTPVPSSEHSVYFPQETAMSAVDFLTMLINHEIDEERTDEQFHPDSPLDQVAKQMNEATLAGGSVSLTDKRIKAIDKATEDYFSETQIDPESSLGKDINKKRTTITSRWVAAEDEGVRKQKLEDLVDSEQSKPGIMGRFLLRRKGR